MFGGFVYFLQKKVETICASEMWLETASWGASEASQIPITPRPQFTDTFRGSRLFPYEFNIVKYTKYYYNIYNENTDFSTIIAFGRFC